MTTFQTDRQRASFEHAHREHDRILAAGPPETIFEIAVDYSVWIDEEEITLSELSRHMGGSAHFASGREGSMRQVNGNTLAEAEDMDDAEEQVKGLLIQLEGRLDSDNIIVTPLDPSDDERDPDEEWDW